MNEGRDVGITTMIWNQAAKYLRPQLVFRSLDGPGCILWEQLRVLRGAGYGFPSSDEVRKNSGVEVMQER